MSSISIGVQAEENSTASTPLLVDDTDTDAFVDENAASGVFLGDGQERRGPQRDTVLQDITRDITQDLRHRRGGGPQPEATTVPYESSVPSVRTMR